MSIIFVKCLKSQRSAYALITVCMNYRVCLHTLKAKVPTTLIALLEIIDGIEKVWLVVPLNKRSLSLGAEEHVLLCVPMHKH